MPYFGTRYTDYDCTLEEKNHREKELEVIYKDYNKKQLKYFNVLFII